MKVAEGFPSGYRYLTYFNTKKWNEVLIQLGIKLNNEFWTENEKRFVTESWKTMTDTEIANVLGKSKDSIKYIRTVLGLYRQKQKQSWLEWEIQFLKDNFYDGAIDKIGSILHSRKWETIRAYATKVLRLKRKHSKYKYQLNGNQRICKSCELTFPETDEHFYRDDNSFRAMCINCYNKHQERIARSNGVLTRKYKSEMYEKGYARCSKCNDWKVVEDFRIIANQYNQMPRYCIVCEKIYMKEYHLKIRYGDNFKEVYIEENNHLFDMSGIKWDSMDEVFISNWLYYNGFVYEKGPYYKEVFNGEKSKRKFDWKVYIDNEIYLVEYFGLWDKNSTTELLVKYTNKAKRKLKQLYKKRFKYNFIVIFPMDLKTKELNSIFSRKSF